MPFTFARHVLPLTGLALSLSTLPSFVCTESPGSESLRKSKHWLSWLVNPSSKTPSISSSPRPGSVYAWGGKFGRTPQRIDCLGDRIVRAAASGAGYGIAVDESGDVMGFEISTDGVFQRVLMKNRNVLDVALREGAAELVMLDKQGRLWSAKYSEGGFGKVGELQVGGKVEKVECGKAHCVGILKGGFGCVGWGGNECGELGRGIGGDKGVGKVEIPEGVKVVDIGCGDCHTLFLSSSGEVFGSGSDRWMQLGRSAEPWNSAHESRSGTVKKAELVRELAIGDVAGGGGHSVLLVRDGSVVSFGFNQWGQLGHHNYSSMAPPSGLADWNLRAVSVKAGENHTCVVKENGELWCIGANDSGQLGVGNLQPSMVWKKVKLGKEGIRPSFVYLAGSATVAVVPSET